MKEGIHPEYQKCRVSCVCGNEFETRSVKPEIRVEVCSQCHPYYAGNTQGYMDKGGRIEEFKRKHGLK